MKIKNLVKVFWKEYIELIKEKRRLIKKILQNKEEDSSQDPYIKENVDIAFFIKEIDSKAEELVDKYDLTIHQDSIYFDVYDKLLKKVEELKHLLIIKLFREQIPPGTEFFCNGFRIKFYIIKSIKYPETYRINIKKHFKNKSEEELYKKKNYPKSLFM